MENFSLLTISEPRLPSSTLKSALLKIPHSEFQGLWLRGLQLEPRGSFQPLILADCRLADLPSNEALRQNCTIYRPWFSPYSYFVCIDKDSQLDSCSFPDTIQDSGREAMVVEAGQAEEHPESISSSSCSLDKARPHNSSRKHGRTTETKDCITSQDILLASKWQPVQQNGYKCVACCRMFPTLHSLKTHIKCGFKEGFSCKVYYSKLKALWEKEHKGRPGDRPAINVGKILK
uniref:Spermatosis associated 46 n=1 Tax=Sphenodon punctatus TaxID=8508 RepID=A0A8D0GF80_SPHPU